MDRKQQRQSVSIVTPGETLPWTVTTVTTGFGGAEGALYDGKNVWVTLHTGSPSLLKLDSAGAILQTVTLASGARIPVFDGTNIWVPGDSGKIFVVRSSTGAILSTLTVPGASGIAAAFDGERVLVAHNGGSKISLWKAADLTPLGVLDTGAGSNPIGVCFDGLNFGSPWARGQARAFLNGTRCPPQPVLQDRLSRCPSGQVAVEGTAVYLCLSLT